MSYKWQEETTQNLAFYKKKLQSLSQFHNCDNLQMFESGE